MRPLAHRICVCFPRTQENWLPGNCYGFINIWDFYGAEHFVLVLLLLDTLVMGLKKPWSVCVYTCAVLKADCKDYFLQYGNWLLKNLIKKRTVSVPAHPLKCSTCAALRRFSFSSSQSWCWNNIQASPWPFKGIYCGVPPRQRSDKWNPQKDY